MHHTARAALAILGLTPTALGVKLLASHYTGHIYTLDFKTDGTTGTLTNTAHAEGCGTTPAWLQYYAEDKKLYCFDEDWNGKGTNAAYNVSDDGTLTVVGQVPTTGNDVHGLLYGGADGKSFVATAQ